MKVKFLGTIAAEGGPALFCNCAYCKEAQRRGGKDIRTRSQMLINDDMLVDFPADTYLHKLQYNLDLSKIGYLLITHSHMDHFYPEDLFVRGAQSAYKMHTPILQIYCNQQTKDVFNARSQGRIEKSVADGMNWRILSPFEYVETQDYEIWSLKAQHMKTEKALFYLIKQGDKAFLQCYDTGTLFEENYEFLQNLGIKIDAVCLDCTMGANERSYFGHMHLKECLETVERMRKSNFTTPNTRFVLTHFCHNGKLLHDEYEKICKPYGVEIAYDGMEMEL